MLLPRNEKLRFVVPKYVMRMFFRHPMMVVVRAELYWVHRTVEYIWRKKKKEDIGYIFFKKPNFFSRCYQTSFFYCIGACELDPEPGSPLPLAVLTRMNPKKQLSANWAQNQGSDQPGKTRAWGKTRRSQICFLFFKKILFGKLWMFAWSISPVA